MSPDAPRPPFVPGRTPVMGSADPDAVSNDVLAHAISTLHLAVGEVKAIVSSLSTHLHSLELEKVSAHAVLESKISAAHARLDGHAKELQVVREQVAEIKSDLKADIAAVSVDLKADIGAVEEKIDGAAVEQKKLSEQIQPLLSTHKVLVFVASGFGLSIIGLIWALIVGRATVLLQGP